MSSSSSSTPSSSSSRRILTPILAGKPVVGYTVDSYTATCKYVELNGLNIFINRQVTVDFPSLSQGNETFYVTIRGVCELCWLRHCLHAAEIANAAYLDSLPSFSRLLDKMIRSFELSVCVVKITIEPMGEQPLESQYHLPTDAPLPSPATEWIDRAEEKTSNFGVPLIRSLYSKVKRDRT